MKAVDKLGNETITDYTDFTPYNPGFPYIQYVHVDDINSSEPFDLNFTVEYQGQKASDVEFQLYIIGEIEKINGEYQYSWFEDVFDYFDGIGELEEYTQRLNSYNIDNINNFKTTYEEGYKDAMLLSQLEYEGVMRADLDTSTYPNGSVTFDALSKNAIYFITGGYFEIGNDVIQPRPIIIIPYDGINRNPDYKTEFYYDVLS